MKFNKLIAIPFVISSALILSRCANPVVQVYNIQDHPIQDVEKTHPNDLYHISVNNIKNTIISAGDSLDWLYSEKQNDDTLNFRKTIDDKLYAIVINYNLKSYSVTYSNSLNLKFDKSRKTIDKSYNDEVKKLIKLIDTKLVLMKSSNEPDK